MTARHPGATLAQAIGANLLELADERGLTLNQVADLAYIRGPQLRRMIDGEDPFNTDHLAKLSQAFRVAVGDLLGNMPDRIQEPIDPDAAFEQALQNAHEHGWVMQRA